MIPNRSSQRSLSLSDYNAQDSSSRTRANTKRARTVIDDRSLEDAARLDFKQSEVEAYKIQNEEFGNLTDRDSSTRKRKRKRGPEKTYYIDHQTCSVPDGEGLVEPGPTELPMKVSKISIQQAASRQDTAELLELDTPGMSRYFANRVEAMNGFNETAVERENHGTVQETSNIHKKGSRPVVVVKEPTRAQEVGSQESALSLEDPKNGSLQKAESTAHLDESPDELGVDDSTEDIPKEKYKPRPSRSRRGDREDLVIPTDFSKRPEKAMQSKRKRKSKRAKTTAFVELIPKEESDEDGEESAMLEDATYAIPNFSKKEDDIPVANSVDATKEPRSRLSEVERPPKKQRGRPRKIQNFDNHNDSADTSHSSTETATSKCIASEAEKTVQDNRGSESLSKTNKATDGHVDDTAEHAEASNSPLNEASHALNEISGNKQGQTTPKKSIDPNLISPEPSLSMTPKKTPVRDIKGPDKHSPINSGKVALRVGLSKRVRIEPLLRIVRK